MPKNKKIGGKPYKWIALLAMVSAMVVLAVFPRFPKRPKAETIRHDCHGNLLQLGQVMAFP
jgi:hypothetical protein